MLHKLITKQFYDPYSWVASAQWPHQNLHFEDPQTHNYLNRPLDTFMRKYICEFLIIQSSVEQLINDDSNTPTVWLRGLRLAYKHFGSLVKSHLIFWLLRFDQGQTHVFSVLGVEVGDKDLLREEVLQDILVKKLNSELNKLKRNYEFHLSRRVFLYQRSILFHFYSRLISTTRLVSYFSALNLEVSRGSDSVYYILWSIFLIYRRSSCSSLRLDSYLCDLDWFNLCLDFCICVICAWGAWLPVLFFSLFSIILMYLLMLFKMSSQILGILG